MALTEKYASELIAEHQVTQGAAAMVRRFVQSQKAVQAGISVFANVTRHIALHELILRDPDVVVLLAQVLDTDVCTSFVFFVFIISILTTI